MVTREDPGDQCLWRESKAGLDRGRSWAAVQAWHQPQWLPGELWSWNCPLDPSGPRRLGLCALLGLPRMRLPNRGGESPNRAGVCMLAPLPLQVLLECHNSVLGSSSEMGPPDISEGTCDTLVSLCQALFLGRAPRRRTCLRNKLGEPEHSLPGAAFGFLSKYSILHGREAPFWNKETETISLNSLYLLQENPSLQAGARLWAFPLLAVWPGTRCSSSQVKKMWGIFSWEGCLGLKRSSKKCEEVYKLKAHTLDGIAVTISFRNWRLSFRWEKSLVEMWFCFYLGSQSSPMNFLGMEKVRFLLVMTRGIKMICHKIPSVNADTGLTFPHTQVVAEGRPLKKSEITSGVFVKRQPHNSTQRGLIQYLLNSDWGLHWL